MESGCAEADAAAEQHGHSTFIARNEANLAEYCRIRGLLPERVKAWRVACEQVNDWDRSSTARISQAAKEEKKRVRNLERDVASKDRALAETAA